MPDHLGHSVYAAGFREDKLSPAFAAGDTPVFLSLHIAEEFDDAYCGRIREITSLLNAKHCRIIADVSKRTLSQFACRDFAALAEELGLYALRLDFGFEDDEILALAQQMPVVLNASTIDADLLKKCSESGHSFYAMHNFYPRPETGLDEDYLKETTENLHKAGLKVMAFIPGDSELRGPLYEGLPTLEKHRTMAPSAAYLELKLLYRMDEVLTGDPGISAYEEAIIEGFNSDGVIRVPAVLDEKYAYLYDRIITNRIDSPAALIRVKESREYATAGETIRAERCESRTRGTITADNEGYLRYSGEIQIMRRDLPKDERVNCIGRISEKHMAMLDLIGRGSSFCLIRTE